MGTRSPALGPGGRPGCIRLGPRPGQTPSPRPPVRIFLGTECAPARATRVFVWSIERHRDPARRYEIHLMKDLPGIRRRRRTPGFTNHRFAIPHLTGNAGRAIYNEPDQIYRGDPAELFDTDLDGAGYRAVTRDDTSVLLIDCAAMGPVWTFERAQRESAKRLNGRGREHWAPLGGEWNVRDGDAFDPVESRVLHFTTLHTQPWRPYPKRFVYESHPQEHLWHELEASADRARFHPYTAHRPSLGVALDDGLNIERVLESAPDEDIPWILDEHLDRSGPPPRISLTCSSERTESFWKSEFEAAARRNPDAHYGLSLRTPTRFGGERIFERDGGRRIADGPPSVWVLTDDRPGNTTQSAGLANALGWTFETKRIRYRVFALLQNRLLGASRVGVDRARSSALEPPWPDLAIAAGRRMGPVLRFIAKRSLGRTRIVMLGRKGGSLVDSFDLSVVPRYARSYPHPKRMETGAPIHAVTPSRLADAAAHWQSRLVKTASPRIAVLVGGTSGQYRLDALHARRLAEDVSRMARAAGGSILATTSRRTGPKATEAFCAALDADAEVHTWTAGDVENPYLGFLALADAFVVTADSESMIAEVASVGRPLTLYPLPTHRWFRFSRALRESVVRRARSRPVGPRGTARPQRRLERFCARLIENGFVWPTRDLENLHDDLIRRGLARRFGEPDAKDAVESAALPDTEAVVGRVRAMMGCGEA